MAAIGEIKGDIPIRFGSKVAAVGLREGGGLGCGEIKGDIQ
jgi:hypothetical protein